MLCRRCINMNISLYPYQVPHVERIKSIHSAIPGALDTSPMGCGKTIVGLHLKHEYGFYHCLVISPSGLCLKWMSEASKYGTHVMTSSYKALTCSKTPYVIAIEDGDFIPSPFFKSLVDEGLFLIIDEISNIKNVSTRQAKACHCLTQYIGRGSSASRILALSATPIDKAEQSESLMKTLGLSTEPKLYEYDQVSKEYTLTGIRQIIDIAACVDPDMVADIVPYEINRSNARATCHDLYVQVLKDSVASSMNKPVNENTLQSVHNTYFNLTPEDYDMLLEGVSLLRSAVRFMDERGSKPTDSWGQLGVAMALLEKSKVNMLIRVVTSRLLSNPTGKVIIFVNYHENVDALMEGLSDFSPLALNGKVKADKRTEIVSLFQAPDIRYRLLIANTRVGGIGIDLDDTHGNFKRTTYIIPSYSFIDIHQASGRTKRATTKSDSEVHLVYGKLGDRSTDEQSIFDAIARKSSVARSSIVDGESILFPGDYQSYDEVEE